MMITLLIPVVAIMQTSIVSCISEIIAWLTSGGTIAKLIIVTRALLTRLMPRLRIGSRKAQNYMYVKIQISILKHVYMVNKMLQKGLELLTNNQLHAHKGPIN